MKKVLIHSGSAINNFGDTLLAKTFADWVQEVGHQPVSDIISPDLQDETGLTKLAENDPFDMLVFCGGGYFGEPARNLKGRLFWGNRLIHRHIKLGEKALRNGVPIIVAGVGAGPITHPIAKLRLARIIRNAGAVTVRDEPSRDFLTSLAPSKDIAVAADAALLNDSVVAHSKLPRPKNTKPRVLFNVVRQAVSEDRYQWLLNGLQNVVDSGQVSAELIFDQSGAERSRKDVTELLDRLDTSNIDTVHEYRGIEDLLDRISTADLIVTTKLHVAIVASRIGIPTLSFAGHPKTQRFFDQIDLGDRCLIFDLWNSGNVSEHYGRISDLVGSSVEIPSSILSAVAQMKSQFQDAVSKL